MQPTMAGRLWKRGGVRDQEGGRLFFPGEFGFERMIFPESAYAENAETDDTALLIHALHHGVAPRWTHVTGRIGKSHFEIIHFRVQPQSYFIGHNVSPNLLVDVAYRYAALQINGHDPKRVPSIDRDGEDLILRCPPITRLPSR